MKKICLFLSIAYLLSASRGYAQENPTTVPSGSLQSLESNDGEMQTYLTVGVNFGYPFALPNNQTDLLEGKFAIGIEATYGRSLFAGISFDYFNFREETSVQTGEQGPEPLGYFAQKVIGQFYSAVFGFQPFYNRTVSPLIAAKFGILKRHLDVGIENFEKFHDKDRFAFAVNIGLNIFLNATLSSFVSVSYFSTSERKEADWNHDLNASQRYFSANIGSRIHF